MPDELKSLHETVSVLQQDVNAIRNGEYNPPQGTSSERGSRVMATPDDIFNRLGNVISHLERLNETVYNLGVLLSEDPEAEYWHRLNRN